MRFLELNLLKFETWFKNFFLRFYSKFYNSKSLSSQQKQTPSMGKFRINNQSESLIWTINYPCHVFFSLPCFLFQVFLTIVTSLRLLYKGYLNKATLPRLLYQDYFTKVTLIRLPYQGYLTKLTLPRIPYQVYLTEATLPRLT